MNLGFVCSSLTVTTEKANASSPGTSCWCPFRLISAQAFLEINLIFAIANLILTCALIEKQSNLAIDQNLLIDQKVEKTVNFFIYHRIVSQLKFSD